MGYMTCYSLVVGSEEHEVADERREEVLGWIERDEAFRNELESFHDHGAEGYAKWYEHERDMLRLSRAFPEVLFVLWGEGGEPEDLWKCYYLGDRMQEALAKIEYPPFDPDKLVAPD